MIWLPVCNLCLNAAGHSSYIWHILNVSAACTGFLCSTLTDGAQNRIGSGVNRFSLTMRQHLNLNKKKTFQQRKLTHLSISVSAGLSLKLLDKQRCITTSTNMLPQQYFPYLLCLSCRCTHVITWWRVYSTIRFLQQNANKVYQGLFIPLSCKEVRKPHWRNQITAESWQ